VTLFELAKEVVGVLNPASFHILASLSECSHSILPVFFSQIALVAIWIENNRRGLSVYCKDQRFTSFLDLLKIFR